MIPVTSLSVTLTWAAETGGSAMRTECILNPGHIVSRVLTSVQRPRCLTSAAGDGGVQAGALCDVDLRYLLGTGWVDADCLNQVGICCPTPDIHRKMNQVT